MSINQTNPPSPLSIRDFKLLALARLTSTLGIQMLTTAIGWHVYELTNDPFAIGLVGLFQFVPSLLFALLAGQIIDQVDRARLLALTQTSVAIMGFVLMAITAADLAHPAAIYGFAIVLGIARVFGMPAQQALLPNVVPPESFSKAVALSASAFQIAIIAGPAAAGAAFFVGTSFVYGTAAAFVLVAGILFMLVKTRTTGAKRPFTREHMLAGLKFILARPVMLGAISLDLFAVLFGGIVALLPVFARDILQIGPQGLGLLRCAPAVGATLMSFVLAKHSLNRHIGPWMFFSVVIFGLATIVFGLSTHTLLSFFCLFILGAADMISVYVRTHLTQINTPDDMRGRVAAVNMLFITASNELGDFEAGAAASLIGIVPAVLFGGVMAIVIAGIIAWRVPTLRKMDGWPVQ